jgi:hypothetical protein
MFEWLPIETAPKDGTEVLGYIPEGWQGEPVILSLWWSARSEYPAWVDKLEYMDHRPTHWVPMPTPPLPAS